jgi:DNA-directed RNA polymerase beta' subunit
MDNNQNKASKKIEKVNNDKNNEVEEEEVEILEESEEENNEEEEAQSPSREEKSNTYNTLNINKNKVKDKYLLELKENGLPDLPKNKILSCNVGSLINISLYNGLPISSNISLITDSFQMFPTSDFV